MKRFFTMLFTALLLTAAVCVSASASDFDSVAQDLSSIGMFRGTAKGFELDRAPTRSEAAIRLVRLYGAEDEAKAAYDAGEIQHPFTDVSSYTSPYVAWLYTKGITKGSTATTFGSARTCTAQNYVVFLLRALGYQDGTDFQYAEAPVFAKSCGFYDATLFPGTFLRDDLAAVTYQALAANVKGTDTSLLDSLIEKGSIDAKAAKPLSDKIGVYRGMLKASEDMNATSLDMDVDMKLKMKVDSGSMDTVSSGNIKVIVDGSKVEMASEMTTTVAGEAMKQGTWMKDGWVYTSVTAGGQTQKFKVAVGDTSAALEDAGLGIVPDVNVSSLAYIDSITAQKSGSDTVYTLTIGKNAMESLIGNMDELLGTETGMQMSLSDVTVSYTVSSQGKLTGMHMLFSATMKMTLPADGQTPAQELNVACDYDMTMTVKATGSAVKITFPDFSDFTEISAAGDTAA